MLIGLGLENMIAVAMPDAVLVAPMDRAQDLRLAVAALKAEGAKQATEFPLDHRPWGWFESLVLGERFQVKRIHVNPGAALSLQSHHHRAEHWIVVQGTAKVTVGDEVRLGVGEPVGLHSAGRGPPDGEPRQGADGADRGADGDVSGRG